MNKYKVCVYAICKNEEKFINRWVNSMSEADSIYVLDTGSTDNSISLLKSLGVNVISKEINPFRFDIARNMSLDTVPDDTDICVCTDIDEVFDKGWRNELEKYWDKDTTRAKYNYNWSLDKDDIPKVSFYIEKIHKRLGYKWTHPVHEVLSYDGVENVVTIDTITVNHYPDNSKSRGSYLPLLELSVIESPNDDRNMHYLGREYMYYGMWEKSIETLLKHLSLESATWKDERSASMRFISRCYKNLDNYALCEFWLLNAIGETPYLREPYVEYGMLLYDNKKYEKAIIFLEKALSIKYKYKSYINEVFCWDNTIFDLLSVCYFHTNDLKNSLYYVNKAYNMDKDNSRIKSNKELIESMI